MSVARDAVTQSSLFTGDTNVNHTPVGTPSGVLVFIIQNGADADEIAGITYGGVPMSRVPNGYARDTSTEFMASYAYFLGAGIPTGTQTVAIDTSAANGDKIAFIFTLTAATGMDTAVEASGKAEENQANPAVTLTTGASVETYVASVIMSGQSSQGALNLGAGGTKRGNFDFGQQVGLVGDLDTNPSGGNVTFTWVATSDDVAMLAVAVKELSGSTPKTGTDSGSGSDSSVEAAAAAVTESGSGADTSTEAYASSVTDTAAGTEVSQVTVPKAGTDSGAGTDASSEVVAHALTEAGTGADSSAEVASYALTDTGAGTETAQAAVPQAVTDTASGADVSVQQAAAGVIDSASGTETRSLTGQYALTDTAAGVESSQVAVPKNVSDTGTGVETSSTVVSLALSDTGTGSDSSTVTTGAAQKAGTEAGSGVDLASLVVALATNEACVGNDLGAILASLSLVDAGTGVDAPVLGIATGDTGSAQDSALLVGLLLASDSATVLDAAMAFLFFESEDTGAGLDVGSAWKYGLLPARLTAAVSSGKGGSTITSGKGGSTITGARPTVEVIE